MMKNLYSAGSLFEAGLALNLCCARHATRRVGEMSVLLFAAPLSCPLASLPVSNALQAVPGHPCQRRITGSVRPSQSLHTYACVQIRVLARLRALPGDPQRLMPTFNEQAKQALHPERPGDFNQVSLGWLVLFCGCSNYLFVEVPDLFAGLLVSALQEHLSCPAIFGYCSAEHASKLASVILTINAQAMMELGATVCRPKNPDCGACPANHCCKAYAEWKNQASDDVKHFCMLVHLNPKSAFACTLICPVQLPLHPLHTVKSMACPKTCPLTQCPPRVEAAAILQRKGLRPRARA
eukprot:1153765-Pelagomonas_calceolata.AAC.3